MEATFNRRQAVQPARQLPGARKVLSNEQLWRVDEWKEHKQFHRAFMRYLRTTDASMLQFHSFWNGRQPPDSTVYRNLYQAQPEMMTACVRSGDGRA